MPSRSARRARVGDAWLSLGAAARLVGVDPDTLRRWADGGRIEAFTTPGGHRRFSRASLESLTAGGSTPRPRLDALGAGVERLAAAYRRAYRARGPQRGDPLAGSGPAVPGSADEPSPPEIARAAPGARAAFRADGRQLLAALVGALESEPPERDERERVAAECCVRMAHRLAAEGRGLTDAIALFVLARRPFLAEIGRLGERRALDAARLARLYDEAAVLLDRLLLRFVAAHAAATAEQEGGRGAPASSPSIP